MNTKNQQVTLNITSESGAMGVGDLEGKPLFVRGAIAGETHGVKLIKVEKKRLFGKSLGVLAESPDRAKPFCGVFPVCGGCTLQHLRYQAQCERKQASVEQALASLESCPDVLPIMAADLKQGFRNKAQFAVAWTETGIQIGLYASHSVRIVDTKRCPILPKEMNLILEKNRAFFDSLHPDYSEESWPVDHLVIRYAQASGECVLALVTKTDTLPFAEAWVNAMSGLDAVVSLQHNVNPDSGNTILGQDTQVLWGKTAITETINDVHYQIGLNTFFQSHLSQTKRLFDLLLSMAGPLSFDRVVDYYCGVGAIGLQFAKQGKQVLGVELIEESVALATQMAQQNGLEGKARFMAAASEEAQVPLSETDLVVIDPPRKGCDLKFLQYLSQSPVTQLIYVSCNPKSLARDCKVLAEAGFKLKQIQPIDMFPHTLHVETVVSLLR